MTPVDEPVEVRDEPNRGHLDGADDELGAPVGPDDRDLTSESAGRVAAVKAWGLNAADQARAALEELRGRSPVVDTLARIVERFLKVNGSILAGYLTYRLFLLLVPLAVILVALAGYSTSSATDTSEHLRLGASVARTISAAGADAQRGRLPLLASGLVGFTYTAWGMLGALQFIYAQAWAIPTKKFPGKSRRFLKLSGSLLLFGVVFYVSALVRQAGVVAGLASSLTTLLSVAVAYLGLGWILPRRSKEWFWLLPGAGAAALGHVVLQVMATFYLPNKLAGASATYGAFGITLTLLSYLFLLGLLLVLAPVVNAAVFERYEHNPPGLLRRIADKVPFPTTTFGSGYVEEGSVVEAVSPFPASKGNASS
jgi:uncharacterized BrkB/YihY/UPF0761 family membrane protein